MGILLCTAFVSCGVAMYTGMPGDPVQQDFQ
jgi:hypothetical protein